MTRKKHRELIIQVKVNLHQELVMKSAFASWDCIYLFIFMILI